MSPADFHLVATSAQIDQIVDICNQPLVYGMLFDKKLLGVPYSRDDAEAFLAWAKNGWQEQSHFVFVLIENSSETQNIIGALDIKSPTLRSAEIGYWLDSRCSGVMTAGVIELSRLAKENEYQELFARVRADNQKSARVLVRAGFDLVDGFSSAETDYLLYSLTL